MSTLPTPVTSGPQSISIPALRFHKVVACICVAMLVVAVAGSRLVSIETGAAGFAVAAFVALAVVAPLLLYWREKRRLVLLEAALLLIWELLIASVAPLLVLVLARLRMPLQDTYLGRADHGLGVSVPAMAAWANGHWLGRMINASYPLIMPLLVVAALLPLLMGRLPVTRRFLLANLVALAVGFAAFAIFPAVGPWSYYHFTPDRSQANCQILLFSLRRPGPYIPPRAVAGIVCFPSFHVIWAVLSAAALWCFRYLRIPVVLLAVMIVLSTMTTGWHYFVDVLAGLALAVVSMFIAKPYSESKD